MTFAGSNPAPSTIFFVKGTKIMKRNHRNRRMKRKTKYIILLIIVTMTIGILGCLFFLRRSTDDYGSVNEVSCAESQEIIGTGAEKTADYTWQNNTTEFKLKTMNDGFSNMAFPYPKGWKVSTDAANSYRILDPAGRYGIYVEHTQINWNDEFTDSTSAIAFKGLFDEKLKNQVIAVNDGAGVRYPDQDYTTAKSKATKNSGSEFLVCYEYPDLTLQENSGDLLDSGLFERRYYIRSGNNATVMSFICYKKDRNSITNLAEYIVTNMRPATETYSKGVLVQQIDSETDAVVPERFRETGTLNQIDGKPKLWKIPETSHSALAGMFVGIGKTDRSSISEDAMTYVFDSAYQDEMPYMDNKVIPYTDASGFPVTAALKTKKAKILSENAEQIIIQKTALGNNKLIETGDTWNIEQFVLKGVKKTGHNTYIVFGYPYLKSSSAAKMANLIVNTEG